MKFLEFNRFCTYTIVILSSVCVFEYCRADTQQTITEQTQILWSLAPCQSAFWVPSTSSEFNQNWITYQYEGNPLSQFGECIFTLESDPNTRIEMIIQQMHEFGNGLAVPVPCLLIYDVKADGSVHLLKKECNTTPQFNQFEMFSLLTETNLVILSTTIRYGSFQIRARAVPKTFGFQTKPSVNPTTSTPASANPSSVVTIKPTTQSSMTTIATDKTPTVMTVALGNSSSSSITPFESGSSTSTGSTSNTIQSATINQQSNSTRRRFTIF